MSDTKDTPATATKRTFSEAATTTEEEAPEPKRPRVATEPPAKPPTQLAKPIDEDAFRAATEILELGVVMDMLMQDLTATDKFFAAKPEEADRVATMLHRLGSRNPVTLEMLASDAQLPLKKFIATVLQRKWLDLDELNLGLYLLPLFVVVDADGALATYRTWMAEQFAAASNTALDLEFETFTVIDAAFATNNIPLLEWCRALRNKLGEEVFDDNYWQIEEDDDDDHPKLLKLANEATRAWWATNVGEVPGEEDEDSDD